MKKYAFRLQTVLDMRQKFLEEKQLEMAKVVSTLNAQIQRLEALCTRGENTRKELEEIYSHGKDLDIMEITNYKNFLAKTITDIKNQEGIIQNTQNILKMKQMEVNDALKEVKVMEKLKEKQEKKFYQHYEYLQAKEIDDIASTRYRVSA